MCSSRRNPYAPHGRVLEIHRGRGFLKAKFLEAMYENKLEFPGEVGGAKQKNLPLGEYGYFLKQHNSSLVNGNLDCVSMSHLRHTDKVEATILYTALTDPPMKLLISSNIKFLKVNQRHQFQPS